MIEARLYFAQADMLFYILKTDIMNPRALANQ
jgi:hypothetical protein